MIGLWAKFALAMLPGSDGRAAAELQEAARLPGESGELAPMLLAATSLPPPERERRLDEASAWLRHHHPQAAKVWQGWEIRDGRLVGAGPS